MPPVIIAAGITAASAIAAGKMASSAQGKATDAQSKATADALAFQKQQEADRKANYDKSMTAYQQKWDAWNGNRMALLQRYGVDIGSPSAGGAAPAAGSAGVPGAAPAGAPGAPQAGPAGPAGPPGNIGEIVAQGQGEGPAWNDWKKYGLGGQA